MPKIKGIETPVNRVVRVDMLLREGEQHHVTEMLKLWLSEIQERLESYNLNSSGEKPVFWSRQMGLFHTSK